MLTIMLLLPTDQAALLAAREAVFYKRRLLRDIIYKHGIAPIYDASYIKHHESRYGNRYEAEENSNYRKNRLCGVMFLMIT